MPGDELVSFCAAHDDVDVAVISVTNPDVIERAERIADELRSAGVPTLVGGAGHTLGGLVDEIQRVAAHGAG